MISLFNFKANQLSSRFYYNIWKVNWDYYENQSHANNEIMVKARNNPSIIWRFKIIMINFYKWINKYPSSSSLYYIFESLYLCLHVCMSLMAGQTAEPIADKFTEL